MAAITATDEDRMRKSRKVALFAGVAGALAAGAWGVSTLLGATLWATPTVDLVGALPHGHQHDVHHPQAAQGQRHDADQREEPVHVRDQSRAADIYLNLSFELLAVCTTILIVVGLVSSLVPAVRASRLDPIEALRYE